MLDAVLQNDFTHAPPEIFLRARGTARSRERHPEIPSKVLTHASHDTKELLEGFRTASHGLWWLLEPGRKFLGGACVRFFVIHEARCSR